MNDDGDKTQQVRNHLMDFAVEWLAKWCGAPAGTLLKGPTGQAGSWLAEYRKLLGAPGAPPKQGQPLLSIFSRIRPDGEPEPPQVYWPTKALSLEQTTYPEPNPPPVNGRCHLKGFAADYARLPAAGDEHRFEAFTHLLHKWAWAVPCSYGEEGVSLYDEFRALSALVHASGCEPTPETEFLLVGGDIPGIQKTIYAITSKGAAKGLRGRSFFIQLLGDAVVQRLLAAWGLPETNVVYAAGGSFMVLAPAGGEAAVEALAHELNQALLAAFEGDLSLCLASVPLPAEQVGQGDFASGASRAVREQIGLQKQRSFSTLATQDWSVVYGPQGQRGVPFCAVCQHEKRVGEKGESLDDGGWKCEQCHGFEQLAQAIAASPLLMFVADAYPASRGEAWQELMWRVAGRWYAFAPVLRVDLPTGSHILSVNDPNFLDEYAHGFRLIANTTPRNADGSVRTFEELADRATGLQRIGVLRMDVDNLGRVLTRWLPDRTMASTSALSQALDRFFSGWLDAICRDVMAQPQMGGVPAGRDNLLYMIYAGGDDLFAVGAWDLMPLLADRVREGFMAYAGQNPHLRISAGITVEDRKFPLYQAAERAGDALDHGAKELVRRVRKAEPAACPDSDLREWTQQMAGQEVGKFALTFLGRVVPWEDYPFVRGLAGLLVELTQEQDMPHSLLTTLRAIHDRYTEDVKRAQERNLDDDRMYYGPWMWRKVYQLARIRSAYAGKKDKEQIARLIEALEMEVLTQQHMPYVGLATRWAEYLTRGG